MATNIVQLSPGYFPSSSKGRPLALADIYVGEPDLDPEIVANQKTLSVLEEDGTVVAVTQPISTNAGGVPIYDGSPVTLLVAGDYSLKVLDSTGSQIYYVPYIATRTLLPGETIQAGNYYYPDYTETDQGAAGAVLSVFDIITSVGAVEKATMYFAHNSGAATTTYTFGTNETITDNFNVIIEDGALISPSVGVTTTLNGQLDAGLFQIFTGAGTVAFGQGFMKEVYPQWFGATGDGTTDDTAAIQACINSVPDGGTVTFLSVSDSYLVDITPTIKFIFNVDNEITVKGQSNSWIKVADESDLQDEIQSTIFLVTASNVVFDGVMIDGNLDNQSNKVSPANPAGSGRSITVSGGALRNVQVKNCTIKSSIDHGIYVVGETDDSARIKDVRITNNYIDDCGGDSILPRYASNIVVSGNQINDPRHHGIHVYSHCNAIMVDGNTVDITAAATLITAGTAGIYIGHGDHANTVYGVVISNNTISSALDGTDCIGGGNIATRISIIGNTTYGGDQGIYLIKITYSKISDNNVSLADLHGIRLTSPAYTQVSENIITDSSQRTNNTYNQIEIDDADNMGTYTTIKNNTCRVSAGLAADPKYNINIGANQDYTSVYSNLVQDATTAQIVDAGSNTTIRDNNGYRTECQVFGEVLIDAVAVVTLTVAHGLAITPSKLYWDLTLSDKDSVTDWGAYAPYIWSTDAANVVIKLNVDDASATGTAAIRIAASYRRWY